MKEASEVAYRDGQLWVVAIVDVPQSWQAHASAS
jgi:hypothetical protein